MSRTPDDETRIHRIAERQRAPGARRRSAAVLVSLVAVALVWVLIAWERFFG